MNHAPSLAVAIALLGACSPAPQQPSGEDEPRPAVAAMAEPAEEELPPVLDSEGNELDPEIADAVRAKWASEAPVAESEEDEDAAPEDDGT